MELRFEDDLFTILEKYSDKKHPLSIHLYEHPKGGYRAEPVLCDARKNNVQTQNLIPYDYEFLLKISNGVFVDNSRFVLANDYILQHQAIDIVYAGYEWRDRYQTTIPITDNIHLSGKTLLLNGTWATELYHFYFNCIGRLISFEKLGYSFDDVDHIIMPESRPYIENWIDILKIPRKKIIHMPGGLGVHHGIKVTSDELLIPSFPINPNRSVISYMRNRLGLGGQKNTRRIYTTRKRYAARGRHLSYEDEIFNDILKPRGFEYIQLEEYSVSEKAIIFNQAELVLSPHSAGLTNLAFCQSNAKIIEIFSSKNINHVYPIISYLLNLSHYYHVSDVDEQGNLLTQPNTIDQILNQLGVKHNA